jgi:hypothetical protein
VRPLSAVAEAAEVDEYKLVTDLYKLNEFRNDAAHDRQDEVPDEEYFVRYRRTVELVDPLSDLVETS